MGEEGADPGEDVGVGGGGGALPWRKGGRGGGVGGVFGEEGNFRGRHVVGEGGVFCGVVLVVGGASGVWVCLVWKISCTWMGIVVVSLAPTNQAKLYQCFTTLLE